MRLVCAGTVRLKLVELGIFRASAPALVPCHANGLVRELGEGCGEEVVKCDY